MTTNPIDRLAAARPAVPERLDEETLFARITAQPRPQAAAPARRSHRKLKIAVVLIALLALGGASAAAVTGLLGGWHEDTSIVDRPQQWRALYRQATRKLALPPGERWPARTLAANTVTSRMQPGGEAVAIAQVSWECYWGAAVRSGDAAAQARAHAALNDLLSHHVLVAPDGSPENVAPPAGAKPPFAIYANDGGLQYVRHVYARAAAGHPRLLFQSCRANGPGCRSLSGGGSGARGGLR